MTGLAMAVVMVWVDTDDAGIAQGRAEAAGLFQQRKQSWGSRCAPSFSGLLPLKMTPRPTGADRRQEYGVSPVC